MAKGLTATNSIKKLWDVNPSFGGPIVRDKLWFFGTYRYQISRQNVASMWVNKNAGNPNEMDLRRRTRRQQAIGDGTWKNGSRAADLAGDAAQQDQRLDERPVPRASTASAAATVRGLASGRRSARPRRTRTNENHPSKLTQLSWTSPVTSRLLLEANAQLGPYFWWGSRQKNAFDSTLIPVQENGGAFPGINYRAANWSGHTGFTNIVQGSASYITGSHSAKFGFRYHDNDANYPINFYNNSQLKYIFQDGVPNQVTVYADAELAPGTEAEHVRVVRAGSLDDRASVAAGRTPLRAPRRLLPRSSRWGRTSSCPPPWCSRRRTARSTRRT